MHATFVFCDLKKKLKMLCRDRHLSLPESFYKLLTCSYCYLYIFKNESPLEFNPVTFTLDAKNGTRYPKGASYVANADNLTTVAAVCQFISESECEKWTLCCQAAMKCCYRQLSTPKTNSSAPFCPRTWDGWGCFDDTPAGQRSYIDCPSYVDQAGIEVTAYKDCTANGTWYRDPLTTKEWTNYSTCVQIQDPMTVVYVGLGSNIISLLLLIPSCGIFLAFRQLRTQQRIRLHVCFFASFVCTAVVTILWDFLVLYDRLQKLHEPGQSLVEQNTPGCKLLYTLLRYTQSSNFFWMFCEGFYLHRLIVHAFEVPKNLLWYYILGWGASWLPVATYAGIRASNTEFDKKCWIRHINGFEWIIYVPNFLCLLCNLAFLLNILRILLTQIQSHPNEPSGYRRALKASFVLIPLFGIQWGLVLYRPLDALWYEILRTIVQNTQGAMVSLIFCIFNGEVHTHLKNCFGRRCSGAYPSGVRREYSTTSATQFTHVASRSSTGQDLSQDCIPLSIKSEKENNRVENGYPADSDSLIS